MDEAAAGLQSGIHCALKALELGCYFGALQCALPPAAARASAEVSMGAGVESGGTSKSSFINLPRPPA